MPVAVDDTTLPGSLVYQRFPQCLREAKQLKGFFRSVHVGGKVELCFQSAGCLTLIRGVKEEDGYIKQLQHRPRQSTHIALELLSTKVRLHRVEPVKFKADSSHQELGSFFAGFPQPLAVIPDKASTHAWVFRDGSFLVVAAKAQVLVRLVADKYIAKTKPQTPQEDYNFDVEQTNKVMDHLVKRKIFKREALDSIGEYVDARLAVKQWLHDHGKDYWSYQAVLKQRDQLCKVYEAARAAKEAEAARLHVQELPCAHELSRQAATAHAAYQAASRPCYNNSREVRFGLKPIAAAARAAARALAPIRGRGDEKVMPRPERPLRAAAVAPVEDEEEDDDAPAEQDEAAAMANGEGDEPAAAAEDEAAAAEDGLAADGPVIDDLDFEFDDDELDAEEFGDAEDFGDEEMADAADEGWEADGADMDGADAGVQSPPGTPTHGDTPGWNSGAQLRRSDDSMD